MVPQWGEQREHQRDCVLVPLSQGEVVEAADGLFPGTGGGATLRIGSFGAGGSVTTRPGPLSLVAAAGCSLVVTVPSFVRTALLCVVLVFEATRVVVLDVALGTLVAVVGSVVGVWTLAGVTNCTPTASGARVSS